jgi:choline transport protein
MFTTGVSMLLSLITLGSNVAFNNIVNLSIAGLYPSYLISCILLLWRRLQPKGIRPYDPHVERVGPGHLYWGPWRVPGFLGILNNIFACAFLSLLWVMSLWPPVTPVSPETMNFSILTFGSVILSALIWYFVRGRKLYTGPIVEIEFDRTL